MPASTHACQAACSASSMRDGVTWDDLVNTLAKVEGGRYPGPTAGPTALFPTETIPLRRGPVGPHEVPRHAYDLATPTDL